MHNNKLLNVQIKVILKVLFFTPGYTISSNKACSFPSGHSKSTETRYYTLGAATTACNGMHECTMLYSEEGTTDTYYICPPMSTISSFAGYTLYTKGKILKCKVTKRTLV